MGIAEFDIAAKKIYLAAMKTAILALLLASPALADDDFTLYDLLAPDTHQFAITYDVTTSREGAELFFNPIRPGSVATKERVIARATGKELQFEVVSGKEAKTSGLVSDKTSDDEQFIPVRYARTYGGRVSRFPGSPVAIVALRHRPRNAPRSARRPPGRARRKSASSASG